ncbi:unnamed protein product [Caenorhabditis brenneri]
MVSNSTSLVKADRPTLPPHDIIVNVEGTSFYCQSSTLSSHSRLIEDRFRIARTLIKMTQRLPLIGLVDPKMFQLFVDFIDGKDVINDSNVQGLCHVSFKLKSETLREACIKHFLNGSEIPLKNQLQLAEDYHMPEVWTHVFASIKNVQELAEVVPKDLKNTSSDIKDLLLQQSLELLGIRKPPTAPQLEDSESKPEHEFEDMMTEFLDQVEIQNQQGLILADQATLLHNQVMIEKCLFKELPSARVMAQEDPRMKDLKEELRNAHVPIDRNAVRAQIQVVQLKNFYTSITENQGPDLTTDPRAPIVTGMLPFLASIIKKDKRNRSKPSTQGDKSIDEIFRKILAETCEVSAPQIMGNQPIWIDKLKTVHESCQNLILVRQALEDKSKDQIEKQGIPDGVRQVADGANFKSLNDFVQMAREAFYGSDNH